MIDAEPESHSYFIPMVDMLAGVVFLLVILLASVTLVSRQDLTSAASAEKEIADIEAKLAAVRALDREVLAPRRDADAALRLLLSRLHDGLATRGIDSVVDAAAARLTVEGATPFARASVSLTDQGNVVAEVLAAALSQELPCLSAEMERSASCAAYPMARVERAIVAIEAGDPAPDASDPRADARALGFLSSLVGKAPDLLALRAPDGEPLLVYRAFAPPARQKSVTAGAPPAPRPPRIVLAFQMLVPALPPVAPGTPPGAL